MQRLMLHGMHIRSGKILHDAKRGLNITLDGNQKPDTETGRLNGHDDLLKQAPISILTPDT
jgi:hypothetical protein